MENLIYWIIIGLVAGWLAGQIMRGGGFGLIGNTVIGLVGAVIGGYIFSALDVSVGTGIVNQIITALVGAVILLAILNLLAPRRRRR